MLFNGETFDEHYNSFTLHKITPKMEWGNSYMDIISKLFKRSLNQKVSVEKNIPERKIAFLHEDNGFSPTLIHNIVRLFDLKLDIPQILEASYSIFAERSPQHGYVTFEISRASF